MRASPATTPAGDRTGITAPCDIGDNLPLAEDGHATQVAPCHQAHQVTAGVRYRRSRPGCSFALVALLVRVCRWNRIDAVRHGAARATTPGERDRQTGASWTPRPDADPRRAVPAPDLSKCTGHCHSRWANRAGPAVTIPRTSASAPSGTDVRILLEIPVVRHHGARCCRACSCVRDGPVDLVAEVAGRRA